MTRAIDLSALARRGRPPKAVEPVDPASLPKPPKLVVDSDGFIVEVNVNGQKYRVEDLTCTPANNMKYGVGDLVSVLVGDTRAEGKVVIFEKGAAPRVILHPAKVTIETARGRPVTRTIESVTLIERARK